MLNKLDLGRERRRPIGATPPSVGALHRCMQVGTSRFYRKGCKRLKSELSRQTLLQDGAHRPGDLWKSTPQTGDLLLPAKNKRLLGLKMDVTLTLDFTEEE